MHYRRLGRSGLKVSEICLGTMTFGKNFYGIAVTDRKDATKIVERALQAGVNFFDTANIYSYGESEEILGKALEALKVPRDQVVIATKVRAPMSKAAMEGTGDVLNQGLSKKHILASCDASLRRLGVDHIDLYQVHGWDAETSLEETLGALDQLVKDGKVRYLGCSNWSARHLMKAHCFQLGHNWEPFVSLQPYYSFIGRDVEHEISPLCAEEGIGIIPWSPLCGGLLSGKYTRQNPRPKGARMVDAQFPPVGDMNRVYDAIDALGSVAQEIGATSAQVALAWLLHSRAVTAVIIGARNLAQLEDNLKATDVSLTPDQFARLSAVTAPPAQYPQWMIDFQNS